MTGTSARPLVLVANNPFGHHLLASQMLEIYRDMELDQEFILLCNGVTPTADHGAFPNVRVMSFARYRFGALNHLGLIFTFLTLSWSYPKATYHLRGFVVSFLFFLSRMFTLGRATYIYDPRGAFCIEWTEAGRPCWISAIFRHVEARLIRHSFATIVTTQRFSALYENIYGNADKYSVIYNSTSFAYDADKRLDLDGDRIGVAYLGTFNHWHDIDELRRVIESLTQQLPGRAVEVNIFTSVKFHDLVREKFKGLDCAVVNVAYIEYKDIPKALSDVQIGISVVRPSVSTNIASPIKVSDYIANGLIPLMNAGIGDFDNHFVAENSAILYEFGRDLELPDLKAIRPDRNEAIYNAVSKKAAKTRLSQIVQEMTHG